MINLDYKSGQTLHEQIEEGIKQLIINRVLKPDEQLPSVRELSISLTVNPNTVQRAYKQLEQDGFIYSVKGKGNFISDTLGDAEAKLREDACGRLYSIAHELVILGEEKEKLFDIINKAYSRKEEEL